MYTGNLRDVKLDIKKNETIKIFFTRVPNFESLFSTEDVHFVNEIRI